MTGDLFEEDPPADRKRDEYLRREWDKLHRQIIALPLEPGDPPHLTDEQSARQRERFIRASRPYGTRKHDEET